MTSVQAAPTLQIETPEDTLDPETEEIAPDPENEIEVSEAEESSAAPETVETPYNGPAFDFDSNYVRAVQGETTGPLITPIYTNVESSKKSRWPEVKEGYMPILYKGIDVTEKIICITVDDCFQAENLRSIVQAALSVNGKLTIYPIGKNIAKSNIGAVVKWAWENGMEIENHTYNHVGLYHFDDARMEKELWYQSCQLNEVLGVDYKEHFFRPHGGDEREDQRDHAYIRQMGMYGIAMWSVDGSKSSIEKLKKSLKPGEIYLFHTTDNDWNLLRQFIPYATEQGYKLVTTNEMFGLPANETSALTTTMNSTPPVLQPFKIVPAQLKKTTYMRCAAVVQKRLIQLGWMNGEADGEFGAGSYQATGYFQKAMGIDADGIAGPSTQAVLFSDNAKKK